MKKYLVIILLIASNNAWAQYKLVKDLDGDGIRDTVRMEFVIQNDTALENYSYIACSLSSQQFKETRSQEMSIPYGVFFEIDPSLLPTKNGFEFLIQYTRDALKAQFRYDKKSKQIQLIGMSHRILGKADGDGKGKSSVNLLTSEYVGDWLAFDYNLDRLFKVPTVKTKMNLGSIFLEDFSEKITSNYWEKSDSIYYAAKIKTVSTR